MANSLREVKTRIDSTKSTAQITRAMQMVSQSKVRRAQKEFSNYKSFMSSISDMVKSVVSRLGSDYKHPLMNQREIKKTCYLIITSDRGLAGAYNANVFKELETEILSKGKSTDDFVIAAIGRKGYNYALNHKYNLINESEALSRDDVMFLDIEPVANKIINMYLKREIDEVIVIYNHYVNTLVSGIKFERILPITSIEGKVKNEEYIFESGLEKTLDLMLPMYIQDIIYGMILDAKCAEHSSRMNAMQNATDNAFEVIGSLELLYNRARQEVITNELIDIVSGANALGGE